MLRRIPALAFCILTISPCLAADTPPAAPLRLAAPLLAYWDFDELYGATCADLSDRGYDASPSRPMPEALRRVPGVYGQAMQFSGNHLLRVPGGPAFGEMKALSLTAWVQPAKFDLYNEIFRKEDGDQRVLFSFQETGTVLSLGLNIGGYVECDAAIEPEKLLDGRWHLCAATFDGHTMRVHLDGREIGKRDCPGVIRATGLADGCLGSSNGGECFQGAMDELRIYSAALSADDVARLDADGRASLARPAPQAAAIPPTLPVPLLAHWTGDQAAPGEPLKDASGHAAMDVTPDTPVSHARGLYGAAFSLSGTHVLPTAGGLGRDKLDGFACSAWVKPTDLSGFRELFRAEGGEQRILFSFQESGCVLSLGLNIGGYLECDAPLDPARVVDGQWHHCAGTFDGQTMRVFLDGQQIGSEERPGVISLVADVPGYIGSLNGTSEHFQGDLDDLRLYAAALTPEQVTDLYADGRKALDAVAAQLAGRLDAFYSPQGAFAEVLAHARRRLLEQALRLDADLASVLTGKLRAAFPQECDQLAAYAGLSPVEMIAARNDRLWTESAEKLVGMALEYRPLTDHQKSQQTPEQAKQWEEAATLQTRLDSLKTQGAAARFAPEWLNLMLQAGSRVQFRPALQEPVAPYVRPETPPCRTLTADEARAALERDWLHQADGNPTPERIRQEIGWARELAERLRQDGADVAADVKALDALDQQANAATAPDQALYFRVREAKRAIALKNPVLDFDRLLMVDMPTPQGSEWPHETRHRLGYMAVPGARLLVLKGLSPGGALSQLMPQAPLHGSFWRPDLSSDGTRVVFCFKPHNEKSFHLYEINVDGTGLRQLTDGPYDDLDPIVEPDGHILFSTTRGHTYVRCMPPTNAYVLARCEADGKNVYLVSTNNEPDYLPSVMPDGRIVYTRWEYTDKPLWRAQALWTMNPDGTGVTAFWGNQSVWPDLVKDARSIPDSNRLMCTGSAHHDWFSGSVAIIDPYRGLNYPEGLTKVTPDVPWPEVGDGPSDRPESPRYHASGSYQAYYSPVPLSERDFLVSANRGGKFVLYLMDVDGNRELIYEGAHHIFHALPLRPRPQPPIIPDAVAWPDRAHRDQPAEGAFYSANVYLGAPAALQGQARFLRVLHIQPKTYTYWHQRPYISTGPVVSMVQSDGVKQVLGTVPISADGSVSFRAPAGMSLHFQLLDEQGRALQTMRSFAGLMPGERRGCLGCHEMHSRAPANDRRASDLRKPAAITPPPWPPDTVGYERYVQPVLDRHCGSCHQGDGKARKTLDLTLRPGYAMFKEPYVTLTGFPAWGAPYQPPKDPPPGFGIADTLMVEGYATTDPQGYATPAPMTRLSARSRLIAIASSGKHHGVKVDEVSRQRLICWVDTMCPYFGEEEIRQIPDPVFQGVDWLAIRPRITTAPRIVRPGPVD